jgi:L,D-peptidoglycan transpeptidase YkuD (ErfK/YbiS/YcfS/YnhG family)
MIIVNKSGNLFFGALKFRCALGKCGVKRKKKEGDGVTPQGVFQLIKLFYRSDKINNIQTSLKKIKIKKNMGWCDDPTSRYYNKQIKLPSKFGYEKLYRSDRLYDLIIVLNYNINPTIKNKGSAIFIHVAHKNFKKTKGCIALNKNDLLSLLSLIKKNTKIKIY